MDPPKDQKLKEALINKAVGILIPKNNPSDKDELRHGIMSFERDKNKGFINYLWKSVLTGFLYVLNLPDQRVRK
jgi:hypothetical protein